MSALGSVYLQVVYLKGPSDVMIKLQLGEVCVRTKPERPSTNHLQLWSPQPNQGSQTPISPDRVSTVLYVSRNCLTKVKGIVGSVIGGTERVLSEFTLPVTHPIKETKVGRCYDLFVWCEESGKWDVRFADAGMTINGSSPEKPIHLSHL